MMILGYLLVAAVALAIGFIGGKLYTEKNLNTAELQKQVDDTQQQMDKYREDVSANLAVTQNLMSEMKQNYDKIVEQMNQANKLLEQPRVIDTNIQYFGSDATEQFLAQHNTIADSSTLKNEQIQAQPSDYSDTASGLFDNKDKTTDKTQVETS